jgi:hypothetical protein
MLLTVAGCDHAAGLPPTENVDATAPRDMAVIFPTVDLAMCAETNACGDCDPGCGTFTLGPDYQKAFPLQSDANPDPNESDNGITRDVNGWVGIRQRPPGDTVWIANSTDWGRGTISRVLIATMSERARYFTVTCSSLPMGSSQACDGTKGCCALDDDARWQARRSNQQEPPHQGVQLASNSPSRTAVDFNADIWVANRAPAGQASITKIANSPSDCIDRNKSGKLDTSSDVDGDGLIDTDCNHDGLPDDIASVKALPCLNGKAQEFYGLDDECVLFTTNVGVVSAEARALTLGPGPQDFGPSSAWAGTTDGRVVKVDGVKGLTNDERQLPDGCVPWGMTTDNSAIAWVATLGPGPLCWFDTKTNTVGTARVPDFGTQSWGVNLDRDQNVWIGGLGVADAYRYTPDRSSGLAKIGAGAWIQITGAGTKAGASGNGRGIVADSRNFNLYFAWLATDDGWISRIPASTLPPAKMDQTVDGSAFPALSLGSYHGLSIDVGRDQNLYPVSASASTVIRIPVDIMGVTTPPDLVSKPQGNARCPAGDRCPLTDVTDPGSDDYSNFTSFGLLIPPQPASSYAYVIDSGCQNLAAHWLSLTWDGEVPMSTAVEVLFRSGATSWPDQTWSQWSVNDGASPIDLSGQVPPTDNHLQVEFNLRTTDKTQSPKLKGFSVVWECVQGV